jgi:cytochrome P450
MKACFATLLNADKDSGQPSIVHNLLNVREDDKRKIRDPEAIFRESMSTMPAHLRFQTCNSLAIDLIFAGQGSMAAGIASVMYDFGLHPEWQDRIRTDLKSVTSSSTYSALWNLPTLQAVIRESWRLSPPFLGVFERVVAPGGEAIIPGLKSPLPVGTRVASTAYIVMRSKDVFGDDAENFRPERWLASDDDQRKALEDAWIVFGRGSRGCVGKDIALMATTKVIVEVMLPSPIPVLLADLGRSCQGSRSKVMRPGRSAETTLKCTTSRLRWP